MTEKRSRGRTPGFRMSEEHRGKIANSNILKALLEHIDGKREMSATQVSAGIALLKKVLPDLQSVQHSGDPENPIEQHSRVELVVVDASNDQGLRPSQAGTFTQTRPI